MGDPAAAQAAVLAEAGHPEAPEAHQAGQAEPQDEVALRQPVGVPRPQGGQEQRQQQPYLQRQHPVEYDSDSQSDWEPGEADDADVVYAWERFDDRGRPLPEQQQPVASSASQPDPRTPEEATAMLAKFRAIRRTPEELQRLLDARADPNMTVGEGNISPMENIMTFAREMHVPHE